MRISDWSSDVCSSDLPEIMCGFTSVASAAALSLMDPNHDRQNKGGDYRIGQHRHRSDDRDDQIPPEYRSEEHTSELQSLMRISYAVLCLKKKKNKEEKANTTYEQMKCTSTKQPQNN